MLGFIFIDKQPVKEIVTKFEEIIDETIEEEEVEDEAISIKPEICNETQERIESKDDEEECEITLMDDDDAGNDEEIPIELEMIEEEYLNDSSTEIEKGML